MKTLVILVAAVLGCTTLMASNVNSNNAKMEMKASQVMRPSKQFGGGPMMQQRTPEQKVKDLPKDLKLTDDQKKKLTDLYKKQDEERMKRMQEMMNNGGGMPAGGDFEKIMEEVKARIKAENDAELAEVKTFLNDEQYKIYEGVVNSRQMPF
ncbi:MAG: hypothetical protein J6Y82_06120 [Bacteroidales bacterium]|nr:hypothetical protein [Bacteroidales bacterium]